MVNYVKPLIYGQDIWEFVKYDMLIKKWQMMKLLQGQSEHFGG